MEKLRPDDPEQLGPYKIIARLGSGGMGVVFLGSKGSRRVAVKVVRSSFLDNPSLRTRFEREIDTLKKLKSPHVAAYLESDVEGELAWHAVEFINGPTLKERIEHDGPMESAEWWAFYGNLKTALSEIHSLGVIHRDLKPSNIILSEAGLKLIDFGIAQDAETTSITTTGTVTGSPAWLSPEQLEGTELGPASDLFSAGSILVYAALGRSPWGSETTMTVPVAFQRILSLDLHLDGLNPEYEPAVRALLRSEVSSRSFEFSPARIDDAEVSSSRALKAEPVAGNFQQHRAGAALKKRVPARPSRKASIRAATILVGALALGAAATIGLTNMNIESSLVGSAPSNEPDTPPFALQGRYLQNVSDRQVLDSHRNLSPLDFQGPWVSSSSEAYWAFSELNPQTASSEESANRAPTQPSFWESGTNYAVLQGELVRWGCLPGERDVGSVFVYDSEGDHWVKAGESEERFEDNCSSNTEEVQRLALIDLEKFMNSSGCVVVGFQGMPGQPAVGCLSQDETLWASASRGSVNYSSEDGPIGEVALLESEELQFDVISKPREGTTFSLAAPVKSNNPVRKAQLNVTDTDDRLISFNSWEAAPWTEKCPYGFEMRKQGSANPANTYFLSECGTPIMWEGSAQLRLTYENGAVSTHEFSWKN